MALCIALRTDKNFDGVKAFISSKEIGGFAVREITQIDQNEHWHWLLETESYRNIQAFRVALTRAVPELKGNASYSATVVNDREKYIRYMCKGESDGVGPEVAWRNSLVFTDEKVEELHVEFWQENKKLKKRKVGSVIDYIVDECKRDDIDWKDREAIALKYVTEISKRAKPFNQFSAKSAVNAIQLQLCPDDSAIRMFAQLL